MEDYITGPLPRTVVISGVEYPIQTDFRTILRYDSLIKEGREDGSEMEEALLLMFGDIPENMEEAIDRLGWFIQCGKEDRGKKPSNQLLGINNNRPMDFGKDARLIWAAFRRVYGIDLRAIDYLHWWDFMEMLEELPPDVRLNVVIRYRIIDTGDKKLSKEDRTIYRAWQQYYKIKDEPTEKEEALLRALRNGEDPTPYL